MTGFGNDPPNWAAVALTAGVTNIFAPARAPSLLSPPQSRFVGVEAQVSFSVSVCGTPPFACQWRFNGAVLASATNASLTVTNGQAAQGGGYQAVVSNAFSAVTSRWLC